MDPLSILFMALGLAMDAFAVSVTNGMVLKNYKLGYSLLFGCFFGFFQFIMPILGFLGGQVLSVYISAFDHWAAFALLLFIGGGMISDSFHAEKQRDEENILSFSNMTVLALATSIDAMASGVGFALLDVNIYYASVIIGVVAFCLSGLGVAIGKKIGPLLNGKAELVGGVILIAIGCKILYTGLHF